MRADSPLRRFDPRRLAHYEKENYVAYYEKNWLKLLHISISMIKEAFDFSLWQAIYAAYLVARAEIAFAPFPDNNIPLAENYARRFYQFLKEAHHEDFDVDRAAKLEVNWWIVHRKLFANPENRELVDTLTALYAEAYGVEPTIVRPAAQHRAQGMLYSDMWVNAGKPIGSPLLKQEEEALYRSYVALKEAISN